MLLWYALLVENYMSVLFFHKETRECVDLVRISYFPSVIVFTSLMLKDSCPVTRLIIRIICRKSAKYLRIHKSQHYLTNHITYKVNVTHQNTKGGSPSCSASVLQREVITDVCNFKISKCVPTLLLFLLEASVGSCIG